MTSAMAQRSRILVVDDDAHIVSSLRRALVYEGYDVLTAADGVEGLARARETPPDLAILDVMMPGIDGIEVCRRLRAEGEVAILLLTARDGTSDRVRGLDSGADDYLVKPFAIEELLARLRSHLRRRLSAPERIQVGDLVLEPATRLVRRGHRQIELTLQEFGLLELLIRHPNQVMTRQRILDHVWGYDARPASNVVDIYIHYLRDKVDRGEDRALIHTVRTLGYVLRA
jgi:two-component system, OmpR family, response regulator MprA